MKIYRDAAGNCINIGEWNYLAWPEEEGGPDVIHNPMPDGLLISDEEVVCGWDDGLYAANDLRQYAPDDPRRTPSETTTTTAGG